jgi:hypothetical protein
VPGEQPARLEAGADVVELLLDELVLADGLVEDFSVRGVVERRLGGGLHDADRDGGHAVAHPGEHRVEGVAVGARGEEGTLLVTLEGVDDGRRELVLGGDATVVEEELPRRRARPAELVELAGLEVVVFLVDEEHVPLVSLLVPGDDEGDVGDGRVRDPGLLAVEDVLVAVEAGGRIRLLRVRTAGGLGDGEAADDLVVRQFLAVGVLRGREEVEHGDRQAHAHRDLEAGPDAGDLLADDRARDRVVVALVAVWADADLGHRLHVVDRLGLRHGLAIGLGQVGRDLLVHELPDRLLDQSLFVREGHRGSRPWVIPRGHAAAA